MTSIEEVPNDLLTAITHANRVLYWQENLDADEMPPQWMQPFDSELAGWFERITEERAQSHGASGDGGGEGMVGNELSPGR